MTCQVPVLRILSGRLAGSEIELKPGEPLSIGRDVQSAVVLRGAGSDPIAAELTVTQDRCANLQLTTGVVCLLGQEIAAPATVTLPPFIPLVVGGFALAWGPSGSSRWAEAEALAGAKPPAIVAAPVTARDDGGPPRALAALPQIADAAQRLGPRLALAGGIVLSLMLAVPPALGAFTSPDRAARIVSQSLAERGYGALDVESIDGGEVSVHGVVPTEADRARVSEIVALSGGGATVSVASGEAMADAVADIFRTNGVRAVATYASDGVVRVTAAPLSADRRERILKAARADVPGVRRIDVRAGDVPAPALAGPDVAAKRVASVVSGPDGFVLTADGTRYFPGGILPTGHQIVSIENSVVTLASGGRQTRLAF